MRAGPIGYIWDTGQYRTLLPDGRAGKPVSNLSIVENIRSMHEAEAEIFRDVMSGYYDGDIPIHVVEFTIRRELKHLHLAMAALAVGGWQNVTSSINQRTWMGLRLEYRYLAALLVEVNSGSIARSDGVSRIGLYVDGGLGRFWGELDILKGVTGNHLERIIPSAGACAVCMAVADRGWLPVGSIRLPIHISCRCGKEYQ